MTWTDNPITAAIKRKKTHITELLEAVYERSCVLCWNDMSATDYGDYGHPFWYVYNSKAWGDDYPKADSAHWPPLVEPDNEYRKYMIEMVRHNLLSGSTSYPGNGDYGKYGAETAIVQRFINPNDDYFRPYGDNVDTVNGQRFDYWKDALGDSASNWTDSTLNHALETNPTKVRACHINELRQMIELLRRFYVIETSEARYRRGYFGLTGITGTSYADAWTNAKAYTSGLGWSAWAEAIESYFPYGTMCGIFGRIYGAYNNVTHAAYYDAWVREVKDVLTFDFDIEIADASAHLNWSVLDTPIKFDIYGAGYNCYHKKYDGNWYDSNEHLVLTSEDYSDISGCMVTGDVLTGTPEIIETSQSNCEDNTEIGERGYYIGTISGEAVGNNSYAITLTSVNNFSDADMDLVKPAPDALVTDDSEYDIKYAIRGCYLKHGNIGEFTAADAYAVIEPDWKYGLGGT